MMRTHVSQGASIALLVVLLLGSVVWAQEDIHPTIVIEEPRHDLGEIYEQKAYRHTFKVKNTGKADLHIKNVKPG
jgi:hypothetical protein